MSYYVRSFFFSRVDDSGSSIVFVSGAFIPAIPQIAEDLDTTGSVVR